MDRLDISISELEMLRPLKQIRRFGFHGRPQSGHLQEENSGRQF